MLAGIFISGGADALKNPEPKVKMAEAVTGPLSRNIKAVPDDAALLVRVNGGVQVAAGVLMSLGKFRRLSALVLAASIIPTTYAGHRFWEEVDDAERAQQRAHFLKNVGILGGLLLAVADTQGAPSTSWRVHRRMSRIRTSVAHSTSDSDGAVSRALESVSAGGSNVLRKIEDIAATEGPKLLDAASQHLSAGAEAGGNLLAQTRHRIANSG
jgi:putative oxidoreductase